MTSRHMLILVADLLKRSNYFDTITGAVVDKPKKPDPFLLKKCIKTLKKELINILRGQE